MTWVFRFCPAGSQGKVPDGSLEHEFGVAVALPAVAVL